MNYEGLIPIVGGVVALLMAYGIIPVNNDPMKNDDWIKKWKPTLTWLAPGVIVLGFLLLFRLI